MRFASVRLGLVLGVIALTTLLFASCGAQQAPEEEPFRQITLESLEDKVAGHVGRYNVEDRPSAVAYLSDRLRFYAVEVPGTVPESRCACCNA